MFTSSAVALCLTALGALIAGVARAEVDARGAFTTEVAIAVPAFHSLTPDVRLSYHSAAGPGLPGASWNLAAGSRITRSSSTRGVTRMGADDIFWLDGAELIPCVAGSTSPSCATSPATFGSMAGSYSTRIETFQRIRRSANGSTWTVWDPSGVRSEYGSGNGGASYQLWRKTDTFGNAVQYAWVCNGGCELNSIRYGSWGQGPGTEVRFYREPRPDPWREQTGGGPTMHTERLRSVVVMNHGQLLRAYKLTYAISQETRASLLTSVQQFGRDAVVDPAGAITAGATPPLPPITFSATSQVKSGKWVLSAETNSPALLDVHRPLVNLLVPRYGGASAPIIADVERSGPDLDASENFYVIGDFNGDGRAELATWAMREKCKTVSLRTYPTSPGGLLPTVSSQVTNGTEVVGVVGKLVDCKVRAIVADVNGDGLDDILVMAAKELRVLLATTSGAFKKGPFTVWNEKQMQCVTGDVDGDGRDDLICENPSARTITTYRAASTGWAVTTKSTAAFMPDHKGLTLLAGDVDGDGLTDIVLARTAGGETRITWQRASGDGTYGVGESQTLAAEGKVALGDFDGDGKLDLIFYQESLLALNPFTVALSRKGHGPDRWRLLTSQYTPLKSITLADVNGDGLIDIVGQDPQQTVANVRVHLAIGEGVFAAAGTTQTTCDASGTFEIVAADWNGDGLADPTCIMDNDGSFTVFEGTSQPSAVARHRWLRADIEGDGQPQLLYVSFRNPGYSFDIVSPVTQKRTTFDLGIQGRVGLIEPDAARWIVADVGSPSGPADGKEDLILIEHVGGKLVTTTLLSMGGGAFTVVQGEVGPALGSSTHGWRPLALDRSGRASLIRLAPVSGATQPGVVLWTLRPSGPGQFGIAPNTLFGGASVAPLRERSSTGFRIVDLDGDGLPDLVHVDREPGGPTTVRSARSTGNGFVEAVATLAASLVAPRAWQFRDMDGDGTMDMFHVRPAGGAGRCVLIAHLAGDGRGGFSASTLGGQACQPDPDPLFARLLEDTAGFIAMDLDRDGRSELVHLTHALDATGQQRLVLTQLRRDLTFPVADWRLTSAVQPLVFDAGDAWRWAAYTDPVSGDAGLSYIHPQLSTLLKWQRFSGDELNRIDNGIGLQTSVIYAPLMGGRDYLPAGHVPRVVARVETRDRASNPVTIEGTDYKYSGARWSDARGALLGFATRQESDGRRVSVARYLLGDACGALQTRSELRDPSLQLWGHVQTDFISPGAAPPFRCLESVRTTFECERSANCRTSGARKLVYDEFGNVKAETNTYDGAATTVIESTFIPNQGDYILDRLAYRTTKGLEAGALKLYTSHRYYYDNLSTYANPPLAKGAMTRTDEWNDQTGVFDSNRYVYSAQGVLKETITPESRSQTVEFDSIYGRFPTKVCDALHCLFQTWDHVLGTVSETRDANGAVKATRRDALGRVVRVDLPDGGFTRTSYLDFGMLKGSGSGAQRIRTEVTDGSANDGVLWQENYFDGIGRTWLSTAEGAGSVLREYSDASNRPRAVSEVHSPGVKPTQWTRFAYDGLGRPVSVTLPDGSMRQTEYRVGQRSTKAEDGTQTVMELNGRGAVVRVLDAAGASTRYAYDALGRLTRVTDALGHASEFAWGSQGQQVATRDPDRGQRRYTYTPDGQLAEVTDAAGQRMRWAYDVLGRPAKITHVTAAGSTERTIQMTYDLGQSSHGASIGRLVRTELPAVFRLPRVDG